MGIIIGLLYGQNHVLEFSGAQCFQQYLTIPLLIYKPGLHMYTMHHVFENGFTNFFLIGIEPFDMLGKDFIGTRSTTKR